MQGNGQANFSIAGNGTVANPIRDITASAIQFLVAGPATVTAEVSGNVVSAITSLLFRY